MRLVYALVLPFVAAMGCTPTMEVTHMDATSGAVTVTQYAPYYEIRTLLVPDRIGLDLVVDQEKKIVPGVYQLQQAVGALGPGDLDAMGLFTAYVHNLTNEPQSLNIASMSVGGNAIPEVPTLVTLKPDSYEKVVLGRVGISNYARELKVKITYSAGTETVSRTLIARRLTPSEIEASVARWKGKKKNVAEFFPD